MVTRCKLRHPSGGHLFSPADSGDKCCLIVGYIRTPLDTSMPVSASRSHRPSAHGLMFTCQRLNAAMAPLDLLWCSLVAPLSSPCHSPGYPLKLPFSLLNFPFAEGTGTPRPPCMIPRHRDLASTPVRMHSQSSTIPEPRLYPFATHKNSPKKLILYKQGSLKREQGATR
jgi:hypothetical protein